jgi:hypothetical protein
VVDVGCRRQELRGSLGDGVGYVGIDLGTSGDVQADLGRGLPLRSRSVETVVALDVLEHTDDIHTAFAELCRVSRDAIVITLPNMYDLGTRRRLLLGRPISAKYGLPVTRPDDRHRWFFSLDQARRFCAALAHEHGWEMTSEGCIAGPRRQRRPYRVATRRFPSLFCSTYLVVLRPIR